MAKVIFTFLNFSSMQKLNLKVESSGMFSFSFFDLSNFNIELEQKLRLTLFVCTFQDSVSTSDPAKNG